MPKKTVNLKTYLPFYRKDWKGKVPWEDIWVRFKLKRKPVTWFPMIQGRVGLRDQLESAVRIAENEQQYLETGIHPADQIDPIPVNVQQEDGSYKETTLEKMIFGDKEWVRPPANPKKIEKYRDEARELYKVYTSNFIVLRTDGDGWDDWIFYPEELIGRYEIEEAIKYGLEKKFCIYNSLRFKWRKVNLSVTPASGGWDEEVEFPDWIRE